MSTDEGNCPKADESERNLLTPYFLPWEDIMVTYLYADLSRSKENGKNSRKKGKAYCGIWAASV